MPPLSSPSTAPTALAHPSPPPFEVADIVRAYGAAFRATHTVSHEQARVLRAIAQCRTAALGGHVEHYVSCGTERVCYDSCRNRHCPKCQGNARAKWLAAAQALLLPIPYFHVVFTLPHPLNPLLRVNQRLLYDLLFQTAAPCPLCGHPLAQDYPPPAPTRAPTMKGSAVPASRSSPLLFSPRALPRRADGPRVSLAPLSAPLARVQKTLSFPCLSLACGSLLFCLSSRSPLVSPLAEQARRDRIPIAPTG